MFEVTVTKEFEATHALQGYRGANEAPHSHRWRLKASIASGTLDCAGCAIDFASVDEAISKAIAPLVESPLHENPIFAGVSPSAENVARHIYKVLSASLDDSTRRVARVVVWEDELHAASYFE